MRHEQKGSTAEDWWAKQSDETVWDDMYTYCTLVKGNAAYDKQKKLCCGESYPCRPKACVKQHKWTTPTKGPTKAPTKAKATTKGI